MFTIQPKQGGRSPVVAFPGGEGQPALASAHVALAVPDAAWLEQAAAALETQGYRVSRSAEPAGALASLRDDRPALLVLDGAASELRAAARMAGVALLAVVAEPPEPATWVAEYGEASDWVLRSGTPAELAARAGRLLYAGREGAGSPPRVAADARFFSLVIHDLRTPLNVIGLSLRMIGQAVPKGDPDLDEDLRFVEENFKQIERMLTQLSDYFRLVEGTEPLYVAEFSPEGLVAELLESRPVRPGVNGAPVRLNIHGSCPRCVALDPARARLALQHALTNALAAAGDGNVAVTLRGGQGRWVTEITTDRPAPGSVQPTALRSGAFERLCGTTAERRGMDLAIAARVTELFQGSARLDVPAGGTVLVFDWPERLPDEAEVAR